MHRFTVARLVLVVAAGLLLLGCGDTPQVREAATSPPLVGAKVDVTLTGNSAVTIADPSNDVTFKLDDARLLVVHVKVHSTSGTKQNIAIRASLLDSAGKVIGDATGGTLAVNPGADAAFDLTGPMPNGTISKATFEVHATPAVG